MRINSVINQTSELTMKKFSIFLILCFALHLTSCKNNHEVRDFTSDSPCFVYEDEVKTENYNFGRVESIDTSEASGCAKMNLANVYLLYIDSIRITVYNDHPKKNIEQIKKFINEFQSDTTRLSSFVRSDSSINIIVDRLCKDSTNDVRYGQYVDWRAIEYSTRTSALAKTSDVLIKMWYSWKE
jgi:hypothetical protein